MHAALERWDEISPILDAALDAPPDDRDRVLAERCGDDAELTAIVRRLLADQDDERVDGGWSTRILAGPLWGELAAEAPGERAASDVGREVGPYRLVRPLGQGGMAEVHVAERVDGAFEANVALKIMMASGDHRAAARFARERQILADLRHPHIARILDGGELDDDRPYLVMELIDGEPIDRWCEAHGLSVRRRLDLFMDVVAAVEHAHRNLVVHRDLKPSNVLVDREGRIKLLDFGIASLLETAGAGLTLAGPGPLTPRYAAPEQFHGGAITTAVDVYQLGILLYRMLTGGFPYELPTSHRERWPQLVAEAPPTPPSERAPNHLARAIQGDVDTIVLKALRKEPDRRYQSAEQLLEDLRRHREGRTVRARPDTWRYRLGKALRRHAVAVTAGAAIAVLLVISSTIIAVQAGHVARERDAARTEARTAERVTRFLVDIFTDSAPTRGSTHDVRALDVLDRGAARIEHELHDEPRVRARLLSAIGTLYSRYGEEARATTYLEDALTLLDRHQDRESLIWAATALELAQATVEDGYSPGEVAAVERAHAIYRREHGDDHPATVTSLYLLASACMWSGDMARSRELFDRALDGFDALPADTSRSWVQLANSMSIVLFAREETDRALALLERADPVAAATDDFATRVAIKGHLASIYADRGWTDDLARVADDYLALSRRAYGDGSTHMTWPLVMAGRLAHAQGRLEDARRHLQQGLDILEADEHRPAGQLEATSLNLAEVAVDAGDARGAQRIAGRAVEILTGIYGDRTHLTARARLLFARAERDLDRGTDIAALLAPCRRFYEETDPQRRQHAEVLETLGRWHLAEGRVDSARSMLARAVDIYAATVPTTHWKLARGRTALARAHLAAGDTGAARRTIAGGPGVLASRGDRWARERMALDARLD
jgi:serine/threonine-protein kinase